ncbi:GNAT family N-acetyltransferase (plasmid) [Skermanella mucosa]|uniref:GNAT family N-acetyltransferase n=1 Tax=Skermanella mucosa TaxID=1789672 RepID=UPI00192B0237|nr:GNAT family N-acetyltransferase [Skermanella mucosa]UEM24592.1 GNAT family N-acetyltransferase [Skermanella mucosa]
MQIDVLDDVGSLARVRENWDEVYASDPEAQFFLSWGWIAAGVVDTKASWLVLAARPSEDDPDYVAFFAIRIGTERKEGGFHNEIALGPLRLSDYKGMICKPEFEDAAIPAFAEHVRKLHWASMILEGFAASDRRIGLFLKTFRAEEFTIREFESIDKYSGVNNDICPYIKLPNDWDLYLNDYVSANTRQKVKRFLKKVDGGEFRITHADEDTVRQDLKILLGFWTTKWGDRKGDRLKSILKTTHTMLLRSFEGGSLFLPVLWKEDRPLGALAFLTDRVKGALLFHSAGRDETFTSPPPGFILHAYSIRYAIAQGFRTYDFLRGNEPYKYMYGAQEQRIRTIVISTRDGRNLGGTLDRRSLPYAFQCTAALHQAGRLADAEDGYRQILEADPRFSPALYSLGQVLAARGSHAAAAETFRTLLAVKPRSHKGWFRLAKSLRALGDTDGAVSCCRNAVALEPGFHDAAAFLAELTSQVGGPALSRDLVDAD